jgi:plastocyanin
MRRKHLMNINKTIFTVFTAVITMLTLGVLATCQSPNEEESPGPNEVYMQDISFDPQTKEVDVNATVTWINQESIAHTVVSGNPENPSGQFSSDTLQENMTFEHTFSESGTYEYYCNIHGSDMQGTILVGVTDDPNGGNGGGNGTY